MRLSARPALSFAVAEGPPRVRAAGLLTRRFLNVLLPANLPTSQLDRAGP